MDTNRALALHPIDPEHLGTIRRKGADPFGSLPEAFLGAGGEQLRCCLRLARASEELWVIGHAPLTAQRPWREVGPVFVHAEACEGPEAGADFLAELSGRPRVLRSYSSDQAMVYAANRVTQASDVLSLVVGQVFQDHPEVSEVHVRNLEASASSCG